MTKTINVEKREEPRIVWYGMCPYCDKQLKSLTEFQLVFNVNTHIRQKHPEKEQVTKTKEETK